MLFRNRKKNDSCEGKWVGIGGKFEPGEGPEECLKREVLEETGLTLTRFRFHGIIHFISDVLEDEDMYLFSASDFEGEDPASEDSSFSCSEGELQWIPKDEVISLNLWEGDRYFLEPLIAGKDNIELTCEYSGDRLVRVY